MITVNHMLVLNASAWNFYMLELTFSRSEQVHLAKSETGKVAKYYPFLARATKICEKL